MAVEDDDRLGSMTLAELDGTLDAKIEKYTSNGNGRGVDTVIQAVTKLVAWALERAGQDPNATDFATDEVLMTKDRQNVQELIELYYMYTHRIDDLEHNSMHDSDNKARLRKLAQCFEIACRVNLVVSTLKEIHGLQTNPNDPLVPDPLISNGVLKSFLFRWGIQNEPTKKETDLEKILVALMRKSFAGRLRKTNDGKLMKEISIRDDETGYTYGTTSWEEADLDYPRPLNDKHSLDAFIHGVCDKSHDIDLWKALVNLRSHSKIKDYLMACHDFELPFLIKKRNFIAFKNGIYDTAGDRAGVFYNYTDKQELPSKAVSSKYIDQYVDPEWFQIATQNPDGWFDIPTPLFQEILDYQNYGCKIAPSARGSIARDDDVVVQRVQKALMSLDAQTDSLLGDARQAADSGGVALKLRAIKTEMDAAAQAIEEEIGKLEGARESWGLPGTEGLKESLPVDAQKWVYVFLGRLLHELGCFDKWQVILMLKGKAGTGKSMIAKIAQAFFDKADVGVMSNNIERKFGLQTLYDKFLFVCMEMKKTMQLDQSEFQSLVSAEEMSIAQKNKPALTIRWSVPGLICGNEFSSWVDSQGSLSRRMMIVNFKHSISEKDSRPNLQQEIVEQELAALIVKCNIAYRLTAEKYSDVDIWKVVPCYFKEERLNMQKDTDPLPAAIYSNTFELAKFQENSSEAFEEFLCLFEELEQAYRSVWKDIRGNNYPEPLVEEKYDNHFREAGIVIKENYKTTYKGVEMVNRFLMGIRLK